MEGLNMIGFAVQWGEILTLFPFAHFLVIKTSPIFVLQRKTHRYDSFSLRGTSCSLELILLPLHGCVCGCVGVFLCSYDSNCIQNICSLCSWLLVHLFKKYVTWHYFCLNNCSGAADWKCGAGLEHLEGTQAFRIKEERCWLNNNSQRAWLSF